MTEKSDKKPMKVTIRTVAEDAGVSVAAVSKVMRNAYGVSDSLREKVEESIARLGYRPSMAARAMRGRTHTVGILVVDIGNPFLPPLINAITDALEKANYKALIAAGEADLSLETALIDSMIDFRLDGLILIAPRMPSEQIATYTSQIPTVVIGHHGENITGFDTVNSNDVEGGKLATNALIEAGHTAIAMLTLNPHPLHLPGEPDERPSWGRQIGYEAVMRSAGLGKHIRVIPIAAVSTFQPLDLDNLFDPSNRPSAVFCWSDLHAIPLLEQCHLRGLRVPEDLAVIGYDNNNVAGMAMVNLTSIDQNPQEMGRVAAGLLLERIDGRTKAKHRQVLPSLVRRRSS